MKRVIYTLLFLLFVLQITACGASKEEPHEDKSKAVPQLQLEHRSLAEELGEPSDDELLYNNKFVARSEDTNESYLLEFDNYDYIASKQSYNGITLVTVIFGDTEYLHATDEQGQEKIYKFGAYDFYDYDSAASKDEITKLLENKELSTETEKSWIYTSVTYEEYDEEKEYPITSTITVDKESRGITSIVSDNGVIDYQLEPLTSKSYSEADFELAEDLSESGDGYLILQNSINHVYMDWIFAGGPRNELEGDNTITASTNRLSTADLWYNDNFYIEYDSKGHMRYEMKDGLRSFRCTMDDGREVVLVTHDGTSYLQSWDVDHTELDCYKFQEGIFDEVLTNLDVDIKRYYRPANKLEYKGDVDGWERYQGMASVANVYQFLDYYVDKESGHVVRITGRGYELPVKELTPQDSSGFIFTNPIELEYSEDNAEFVFNTFMRAMF